MAIEGGERIGSRMRAEKGEFTSKDAKKSNCEVGRKTDDNAIRENALALNGKCATRKKREAKHEEELNIGNL